MTKSVVYLTPYNPDFSENYLAVRRKENRILTDEEVMLLPLTSSKNSNSKEWKLRASSSNCIVKYLKEKNKALKILDIGCGNGWFSNLMSQIPNCEVVAIDINTIELEQANTVFRSKNLQFVCGDIFTITSFENQFDCITLNGCVQYFPDFLLLIEKLKTFLKIYGEIHIIDSPFYDKEEVQNAKKRTMDYYSNLGFPEMSNYYFHHTLDLASDFKIKYKPNKTTLYKLFFNKSPFMWLCYKNSNPV